MPEAMYDTKHFREDLAKAIACMNSGLHNAIPEQDDYNLAQFFINDYEREIHDA